MPVDALIIESSGMADPAGMARIIEGLAPYLERQYMYMGSICLVDCTTFTDFADIIIPVQNQVASADLIIVNKTDLIDEARLSEVHETVRLYNEEAPVYNTIYAHVPTVVLETQMKNRGYDGEGTNTPYNRPNAYTLFTDAGFTEEQARKLSVLLSEIVLRFKGFLRDYDDGFWHIEGVAGQYSVARAVFSDAMKPEIGRIVLITFNDADIKADVEAAWSSCNREKMKFRAF